MRAPKNRGQESGITVQLRAWIATTPRGILGNVPPLPRDRKMRAGSAGTAGGSERNGAPPSFGTLLCRGHADGTRESGRLAHVRPLYADGVGRDHHRLLWANRGAGRGPAVQHRPDATGPGPARRRPRSPTTSGVFALGPDPFVGPRPAHR